MMARYLANAEKTQPKAFDDLLRAKIYVHTLPKGTVVVISDLQAQAGKPIAYIITAGESGVVERRANLMHPRR